LFRNNIHVNLIENNEDYDILTSDGTYENFRDYIEFPKSLNEKFDVIFVDGRARVEAALSVLRNKLLNTNGVVMVHDWHRPEYKVLLNQGFEIFKEDRNHKNAELVILKPIS